MKVSRSGITALLLLALTAGCSEPDKSVSAVTGDGRLEIRLEAERNWVFPDTELPLRVVVASVNGPVADTTAATVDLIANFGSVSPSMVHAILNGPDAEGAGADSLYFRWVVFKADRSGIDSRTQGEITALMGETMTRLKIRIVDPPPDP